MKEKPVHIVNLVFKTQQFDSVQLGFLQNPNTPNLDIPHQKQVDKIKENSIFGWRLARYELGLIVDRAE